MILKNTPITNNQRQLIITKYKNDSIILYNNIEINDRKYKRNNKYK